MSDVRSCPAILWVGNQRVQCSNAIIGTGPIIDVFTGEQTAPYRHFVGGYEHFGNVHNVFSDEYGHPMNVTVRWTQELNEG